MNVADFIGQLDLFGAQRQPGGVDNLFAFSFLFGQAFVVAHFQHRTEHVVAEAGADFFRRGVRVFNRVVENRGQNRGFVMNAAYRP